MRKGIRFIKTFNSRSLNQEVMRHADNFGFLLMQWASTVTFFIPELKPLQIEYDMFKMLLTLRLNQWLFSVKRNQTA